MENAMTRPARILTLLLAVILISLFVTVPVLAAPPLPSSFYGTVKLNNANVPDGTVVRALIGGQAFAVAYTLTYQGNSVYAIDVPGDDTTTSGVIEGGIQGNTVQFEVGGVLASQTGIWQSGTNVSLDLTVSSSGPIPTPQATPSPVPTQTPITVYPTATSKVILPSPTSTQPALPSPTLTAAAGIQPSPGTVNIQPSPASTPQAEDQSPATPRNPWFITTIILIIIVLILAALTGYLVWALRKKK
jgi:hypothetical protein